MKRTIGASAVTLALFAVMCNPAIAEDNTLRFGGAGYVATDLFSDSDTGYGAFVDYERTLTRRFGLDFAIQWAHYDIELEEALLGKKQKESLGSLDMIPVTLSPNIHLTPGTGVDFYVRPSIGFAYITGDGATDDSTTDLAYGVGLGLDIGRNKWMFVTGVDWLSVETDVEDNFDNVIVKAGAAVRY